MLYVGWKTVLAVQQVSIAVHAVVLLRLRGLDQDHVQTVLVVITKLPLGLNLALFAQTVVLVDIYQGVGGLLQEVVITVQRVKPISSKVVVVVQVQVLVMGVAAIVL